ncbi:unnamed protein product, partial [Mesorhabditis spiculigera]
MGCWASFALFLALASIGVGAAGYGADQGYQPPSYPAQPPGQGSGNGQQRPYPLPLSSRSTSSESESSSGASCEHEESNCEERQYNRARCPRYLRTGGDEYCSKSIARPTWKLYAAPAMAGPH